MRPMIPTPALVLVVTERPSYGYGKERIHFSTSCGRLTSIHPAEMVTVEWVRVVLNNRDMDVCGDCLAARL